MDTTHRNQLPPPTAAPWWQSGDAWMIGDALCYRSTSGNDVTVSLSRVDNILVVDESYKKTPGWAIALAVLLFPIGLFFLMSKVDVPSACVNVYVSGRSTPLSFRRGASAGQTQADWYPVISRIGTVQR